MIHIQLCYLGFFKWSTLWGNSFPMGLYSHLLSPLPYWVLQTTHHNNLSINRLVAIFEFDFFALKNSWWLTTTLSNEINYPCWESITFYILYFEIFSWLKVQSHLYFLPIFHPWWKLTTLDIFTILMFDTKDISWDN